MARFELATTRAPREDSDQTELHPEDPIPISHREPLRGSRQEFLDTLFALRAGDC